MSFRVLAVESASPRSYQDPERPEPPSRHRGPRTSRPDRRSTWRSSSVRTSASAPIERSMASHAAWSAADTTVCVVEAMKVFNAIPAEISGRIVAMLVENEQPVEYNQPLFKVDPG